MNYQGDQVTSDTCITPFVRIIILSHLRVRPYNMAPIRWLRCLFQKMTVLHPQTDVKNQALGGGGWLGVWFFPYRTRARGQARPNKEVRKRK